MDTLLLSALSLESEALSPTAVPATLATIWRASLRAECLDTSEEHTMADTSIAPVLQLRVALTGCDYERLLGFYCAGLGLEPAQVWTQDGGRGLMLELGQGTLELFDDGYAGYIDGLEAGARVSGQVRLALQVPDLEAALERLIAHGATVVHPPVQTPWGDYNARLQDPDGLQVTLFQSGGTGVTSVAGAE